MVVSVMFISFVKMIEASDKAKKEFKSLLHLLLCALFLISLLVGIPMNGTVYLIGDFSSSIFFLYFLKRYIKN